jgi:hypothetical protein
MAMPSQPSKYADDFIEMAVYQVVNDNFLPAEAECVIDLWRAKYAVRQLNGLVGFIDEMAQLFHLDQQRKQTLRMNLYRKISENKKTPQGQLSSSKNDSTVVAFNKPASKVYDAGESSEEQVLDSPSFVVFYTVGDYLIKHVQKIGSYEFQDFTAALEDYLKQSSLPTQIVHYVLDWCAQERLSYEAGCDEQHYAGVIHIFYMALCEALGPVDADIILNDAINQAELLPEAQSYPPKRFL